MKHVQVFPDTNYFMQFKSLDQIDWCKLLSADTVIIQIAPTVLSELNYKKDNSSSSRQQKRAGQALSLLRSLDKGEKSLRSGVQIGFVSQLPEDETLSKNHLNSGNSDDIIIASALEGAQSIPTLVVTGDFGVEIRVRRFKSLTAFQMPSEYSLPSEPDPEIEEIRRLKRQVAELGAKLPVLKLGLPTADITTLQYLKSQSACLKQTEEERIGDARKKYPRLNAFAPEATFVSIVLGQIEPPEIERYNKELDEFFNRLSKYHEQSEDHLLFLKNTAQLNISVVNSGSVPAEHLNIWLHFPDGFRLFTKDELPKAPKEPLAPEKPLSILDKMASPFSSIPRFYMNGITPILPLHSNVNFISKKQGNSYTVEFSVDKLKHSLSESLAPLFVNFYYEDTRRSFDIKYRILADNLPLPTEGVLHVLVPGENN